MKYTEANNVLKFIEKSPSVFHVINNLREELLNNGFTQLYEKEKWNISKGKKYFVIRGGSSIISFIVPENDFNGFLIAASHSDSPCFKIKENPEMKSAGFCKLNVEKYGGMLMNPWFDRPLGMAGRVIYTKKSEKGFEVQEKLVDSHKPVLMIPNLSIHFNREANDGHKINVQNELMPVISDDEKFDFKQELEKLSGISKEEILSYDIYLYNQDKGNFWGSEQQFISSPKLDDLECVYTTFRGFLNAQNNQKITVHAVFDNEETGSESRQGAGGTFLQDVLIRVAENLGLSQEEYRTMVARSFLVSADNAHSVHPNFVSSSDPVNQPKVNGGPVIKFNAAQKYTTDAVSAAVFKQICKEAKVPVQVFTNNSNVAGGSTLGNISTTQVAALSVDIGLAQWAMHSPLESGGARDPEFMTSAIAAFFGAEFNY